LEDHAAEAQLVADHFLTRGVRNFLYYSDRDNWVYEERGRAFVKALKHAGRECTWLRWHASPSFRKDRKAWQCKRDWLASQLKRAAKPLGLFGADDGLAVAALEICNKVAIAVPEEVAIIGAGNSQHSQPDAVGFFQSTLDAGQIDPLRVARLNSLIKITKEPCRTMYLAA